MKKCEICGTEEDLEEVIFIEGKSRRQGYMCKNCQK